MKKVFYILASVFAVGISMLFLLSSCDKKIYFDLQNFMDRREPKVPLVLASFSDSDFEKTGFSVPSKEELSEAVLVAQELGAAGFGYDFASKIPAEDIDSLVVKSSANLPKEKSLFSIKLVFPSKNGTKIDHKTPQLPSQILASEKCFSRHLVYLKDGKYFAEPGFSAILDFLGVKKIEISDSEIELAGFADSKIASPVKIPRAPDGSVLLKYPSTSWKSFCSVPFSSFAELGMLEENLHKYLDVMSSRGLFCDLNSENPLDVYNSAVLAKKSGDKNQYFSLKKKFYMLMRAFLGGKQEKALSDSTTDENERTTIKNSFSTCRVIFSEVETLRTKLSEPLSGSFCVFALVSESAADFVPSPFDSKFPAPLLSYVLANMIFSDDFIRALPLIFQILISLFACLSFTLLALKIRKTPVMVGLSVFWILLFASVLVFLAVYFRIFAGFCIPLASLLILSLVFDFSHFRENEKKLIEVSQSFSQVIHGGLLKKIMSHPFDFVLDGEKSSVSLLSLSIRNISVLRAILSGNQFVAFLNHYFDAAAECVLKSNGIVESYRDDEVIAVFGAPEHCENHGLLALEAALAIKKQIKSINEDIKILPNSPKPDGMNDDLFTAFFILSNNGVKIIADVGVWGGETFLACMGSESKKSFRIADGSWKNAIALKDSAKKYDAAGIMLNGSARDSVRDEYIIRKLGADSEDISESVYEVLDSFSSDDDKIFNYANFWNQAVALLEKGENEKSLAMFVKLSEGRPGDRSARYFINYLNGSKTKE